MNEELESLESSPAYLNAISSNGKMVQLSQFRPNSFPLQYSGTSSLPVSKPSGIGLHLNSIANTVPITYGATANMKLQEDYMGVRGMESASACCPISSNAVGKFSFIPKDVGGKSKIAASFASSESPHITESPNDKCKIISEQTYNYEYSRLSPKTKRTKTSSTIDGDDRHCNCKKTKCLKLYCECFAAGIYCAKSCTCQGCYNRPDYEDTVLDTKQQIESRNPLAFAPKIVQRVNEFNSMKDGNGATPSSSGKHKRGCNCKKSMCLKKYCECYQAKVGCSSGCRCDGCKNVYGRKEECAATELGMNKEIVRDEIGKERFEGTFDKHLEGMATKSDLFHAKLYDPHNITPLTPAFQYESEPKSQIVSRSCLPSPEVDSPLSSYVDSSKTSRTSNSSDMLLQANKESLSLGSYDWRLDYTNVEMMDQFSPESDTVALSQLTSLSDLPFMAMASSTSFKTRDLASSSHFQHSPETGYVSSAGSHHWWSSPITPMTSLEGTKSLQGLNPDGGFCDIPVYGSPDILRAPDILRDRTTPSNSVKVRSPNQKRVSPPQSHLNKLGSSSSGGLRTSGKFILRAAPSFPPL